MAITLGHFLRLLAVWWPCAQSKRDKTRSCWQLYQIFTDFKNVFTDRLSNKPFLMWLQTTPLHLNCVVRLPCNLLLITCFLTLTFQILVWQYVQEVLEFLIKLYGTFRTSKESYGEKY